MPGPHHAPKGGFVKPKNMGKTVSRLLGYLTRSKLPLLFVFLCLLVSVLSNLGGSYMMRNIINDFVWSGWAKKGSTACARSYLTSSRTSPSPTSTSTPTES